MKKVIIGVCILALLFIFMSILLIIINCRNAEVPTIDVISINTVNYNNYILDNQLDYKNIGFAYHTDTLFDSKLTLLNESGDCAVYSQIAKPFQLLDDRIVFIDNCNLLQRKFSSNRNQRIAENVSRFIALEEAVYFLSGSTLFEYRLDHNTRRLKDNVCFFYVHREQIYVVEDSGQLICLGNNGLWQTLCVIPIQSYPFWAMPQGDFLIFLQANELHFVNIYTGITEVVPLVQSNYANNRIHFICDDDQLFVSFQATETNGSLVTDIEHEHNGVWIIDSHTKQLRRICADVFDQLYLFDNNHLFGVKNNQVYQIDTETGNLTALFSQ